MSQSGDSVRFVSNLKNSQPLVATRSGSNEYTITSATGGELRVASPGTPGAFSPEELLQAALAGCAALSAEAQFAHHLGPDFQASSTVEAGIDDPNKRIADLRVSIAADFLDLPEEKQQRLIKSTERIIGRLCAIKRTLAHGVQAETVVEAVRRKAL